MESGSRRRIVLLWLLQSSAWAALANSGECREGAAAEEELREAAELGSSLLQVSARNKLIPNAGPDPVALSKEIIEKKGRGIERAFAEGRGSVFEKTLKMTLNTNSGYTSEAHDSGNESQSGGLHSVVGADGVLMISLPREAGRFAYSSKKLLEANITATYFPGVDGKDPNVTNGTLEAVCPLKGCLTRGLQALVASHHSAWMTAQRRKEDWTLILEDDVIPAGAEGNAWSAAFDAAWALLPPTASIVRLGRCAQYYGTTGFMDYDYQHVIDGGTFLITKGSGFDHQNVTTDCTHAYMVHRTAIPLLESVLPCACVLDCCLQWYLYNRPGQDFLWNIDVRVLPRNTSYKYMEQIGVIVQDWTGLGRSGSATLEARK